MTTFSPSPISPPQIADLLFVDASADVAGYAAVLRGTYRVATTTSPDVAKQFLHRQTPALVVTNLDTPGVDGVDICREAKKLATPPPVLVTTANVDGVPDALAAGCDAVLLKPFAPNLLYARIGRLLRARDEMQRTRARSQMLRMRAHEENLKTAHLIDRSDALLGGTNRVWPNTHCPYCDHGGVTSFEFCSHRRSWYACLQCKKVWIAKRQE